MCVVDRARRAPFLPHPCPISTDFDTRPKLEREESRLQAFARARLG